MAWCFRDEATEFTSSLRASLASGTRAVTPSIWPLEVANSLIVAERRKRISSPDLKQLYSILNSLPIECESVALHAVLDRVIPLAREQGLTSYDAAYLELALRRDLSLATLDRGLRRAAKRLGVAVMT